MRSRVKESVYTAIVLFIGPSVGLLLHGLRWKVSKCISASVNSLVGQLIIYSSMYLVNKDQKDVFDAAKRNALNIWACIYVYMQKSISTTDMPEYSPKKRNKMSRVSLLFSRQGTENLCNYKTLNTSNRSSHFHATM